MDIQKLFIQYIVENDIENISLMLKNKKLDPGFEKNQAPQVVI